jgi:hypothetical protein
MATRRRRGPTRAPHATGRPAGARRERVLEAHDRAAADPHAAALLHESADALPHDGQLDVRRPSPCRPSHPFVPQVKELFRETISGHTCDRRGTKSYIHSAFPTYTFEDGYRGERHACGRRCTARPTPTRISTARRWSTTCF